MKMNRDLTAKFIQIIPFQLGSSRTIVALDTNGDVWIRDWKEGEYVWLLDETKRAFR